MQVSFDVTVPKGEEGDLDGAEAPDGAGNYLPAQVYASQTCTRRENDPNWQCQSLLDYGWGRGAPLEGDQDMLTDGVVRGTLDVQELPQSLIDAGADPECEYKRGVFGNPQCLVTRDTENPEDYDSLASTILPSDYNDRFPGQQQNAIGPAEKVRGYPYLEDISVRGSNDGVQWSSGDGCDQAAVALVCSAPEPSEPGGSVVTTGPDGKPTTVTSTKGPDGKPTVKTTVKSTPPGAAGQAKPPSGGRKWPVTGVEIAGLVALAGAAIALGMALVTWRRGRNGGQ